MRNTILLALLALLVVAMAAQTPAAAAPARQIDVDLAARELVAYEGGAVVLRAPVTTGTLAHPVTPGRYGVAVKLQRATYQVGNSTVVQPWVLDLDGGVRIMGRYYTYRWGHAPEHNTLTLPNGAAVALWNWAAVGTPVTIH